VPKELHKKLKKLAERKGLKDDRKRSYIYSTLQKVKKFSKSDRGRRINK